MKREGDTDTNNRNNNWKIRSTVEYKNQIRSSYDKFPDFFRMDTFIDSTHMKL